MFLEERIRYSETGDIEADWDTDKQQWRGGQVNAGCEICQVDCVVVAGFLVSIVYP